VKQRRLSLPLMALVLEMMIAGGAQATTATHTVLSEGRFDNQYLVGSFFFLKPFDQ
jgi:hypothetical protein